MHARATVLAFLCLGLTGCGGLAKLNEATPPATAAATATPGPDLNERIDLGGTGVGVYQLVTVPVATLHNASTQHAALGVVVHFIPKRGGRALDAVDSPSINIAPGATLSITANCTDTCTGADHSDATLAVRAWGDPAQAPVITAGGVAYQPRGPGGAGFGTVTGTLVAVTVPAGGPITIFAACSLRGGIVGGGYSQDTWVSAGAPQPGAVSVIVSAAPDHCDMYSAVGS